MSETVETAPVGQVQVEKPKRNIWKIIVPIVVITVILSAVLVYWWFSRPAIQQTPWLFEGAYAKYEGETTILSYSTNMTVRLEVVDYNSTHAKLLTYVSMVMDGETYTEQETIWGDLKGEAYDFEGYTLETSYEDHVYFEGLGTRHCMVYEYSITNMTIQIYVDKQTTWPVKMVYRYDFGLSTDVSVELTLVESNIPGLKT